MSATRWGARAAELYGDAYARKYRAADDAIRHGELVTRFSGWLAQVCDSFEGEIDVLDLGCGTGRYFQALRRVRTLTGIDISRPMLDEARHPIGAPPRETVLVEGDFLTHDFGANRFDLVYSIGVLAEHSPFDASVAARVWRWLKPGGRFAFTAVDPLSFSVPRTLKRRIAEHLLSWAPAAPKPQRGEGGGLRRALRARLMRDGLYADEERLRDVLAGGGFIVESIEPYRSDVHLHSMTVARKAA
jgi:SAM-dependent methyltransferase